MKGYKAFKKGMICDPTGHKPYQYAENTVFEQEEDADICKSGFHFCKEPLDVLGYYTLVDENGDMTEFAEVEALDECKTDNGSKYCTKKIKIGAKIGFPALVQASVDFELEKVPTDETRVKTTSKDSAQIGSSGYSAKIGSSGDYAKIGSSGDSAQIGSSGYSAKIGSSGDYAKIGSSGDYAKIGSSGDSAQIGSSGDSAQIGSSGDSAQIGSSGDYAQIGSSGDYAKIGSSGDSAQIGSSGYSAKIGSSGDYAKIGSSGDSAQIGSSGYSAKIGSSGYSAKITSEGEDSVICCAGNDSIAKAKIGSWITLSEWKFDKTKEHSVPVCVKTEYVDGEKIKADTFYKLENGEFVECK
ncbi:DUF7666 domain-containing protein [Eubacterium sp.]